MTESRYRILQRLEEASVPPPPTGADDPQPGATAAVAACPVDECAAMLMEMSADELATVAARVAMQDAKRADDLADMLLDAVYDSTVYLATVVRPALESVLFDDAWEAEADG